MREERERERGERERERGERERERERGERERERERERGESSCVWILGPSQLMSIDLMDGKKQQNYFTLYYFLQTSTSCWQATDQVLQD